MDCAEDICGNHFNSLFALSEEWYLNKKPNKKVSAVSIGLFDERTSIIFINGVIKYFEKRGRHILGGWTPKASAINLKIFSNG